MKIYRVSRPYLWMRGAAKATLTAVAAILYIAVLTNPTPFPLRLLLLIALAAFGGVAYVRVPRMPTEITLDRDGWIDFRSRRATVRIQAADIEAIDRGLGRRTVRVRHSGGKLRMPDRFLGFYDFLASVKAHNPSVAIRGF